MDLTYSNEHLPQQILWDCALEICHVSFLTHHVQTLIKYFVCPLWAWKLIKKLYLIHLRNNVPESADVRHQTTPAAFMLLM